MELPVWLDLEIASLTASTTIKSNQEPDRRALVFKVHPERKEIRLATGEVFCNPRHYDPKKYKGAARAEGTLQIIETMGRPDEPPWSIGAYPPTGDKSEPDYMDAFVQADLFLSRAAFGELLANIRAGKYPATIRIEAEEIDAVKYEPYGDDLSVIDWDNREPSHTRVTEIHFFYEFHDTKYDPQGNPTKDLRETLDINFEDKREVARALLERVEKIDRRIRTAMGVVFVLGVMFLIGVFRN